jgi:hypothetical protein
MPNWLGKCPPTAIAPMAAFMNNYLKMFLINFLQPLHAYCMAIIGRM